MHEQTARDRARAFAVRMHNKYRSCFMREEDTWILHATQEELVQWAALREDVLAESRTQLKEAWD